MYLCIKILFTIYIDTFSKIENVLRTSDGGPIWWKILLVLASQILNIEKHRSADGKEREMVRHSSLYIEHWRHSFPKIENN